MLEGGGGHLPSTNKQVTTNHSMDSKDKSFRFAVSNGATKRVICLNDDRYQNGGICVEFLTLDSLFEDNTSEITDKTR